MNNLKNNLQQSFIESELISLAQKLQHPLSTLRALNEALSEKTFALSNEAEARAILDNSQKVVDMIEGVVVHYQASSSPDALPLIYTLYDTLPNIRTLFSKAPDSQRISKTDIAWLLLLEKTVFEEISKRKINLMALAYELAVSETQLHRNVKKLVGLTPNNYIRILKLYKANQYLEEYTFKTISEVSYAVGFADSYYFSQVFLYQYGVSPKAIRPV